MVEIKDKAKCCGCGACAQVCPVGCIRMEFDTEGCEYPRVDTNACIGCNKCERACRVLNPVAEAPREQRAFLVQHNDPQVLAESTSGGAFSALAQAVIAKGGIVFGAGYLRGAEGERAKGVPSRLKVGHFGVERTEDLWRFRNSKYTQSVCYPAFPEVKAQLAVNREVLFIGTPCQCEGLLGYLGNKPSNLRVADVVCRAVVCRAVFSSWLTWLDAKGEPQAQTVIFRDKGRFGYRYSNMMAYEGDGNPAGSESFYHEGVETDPYLRAFFSDICDRPICYNCPFKKRYRESDLTCWDFFDVYRLDKSFDDNRGVTRVLVQSEKGQQLLNEARNYARVVEIDPEAAVEGAREMVKPVNKNPRRDEFMADVTTLPAPDVMEKWFPDTAKVKAERFARQTCERLGIYDPMKHMVKKVLGR